MGRSGRNDRGTVWITGASSGIGKAAAVELAQAGWRIGAGGREAEPLQRLISSFPDPARHAFAALDVRRSDSVAAWAAELRERLGEPDVVVQCAGWGVFRKVVETTDEEWDRTIDTNLRGIFLVTRSVLPGMLSRQAGRLIYILSVAARTAFPKNAAYNASKFGALGFTEALRAEVRRHGVRVTAILPGATETPFWDRLEGEWDRSQMMPPRAVAQIIRQAAEAPEESLLEEVRIAPPLGNL